MKISKMLCLTSLLSVVGVGAVYAEVSLQSLAGKIDAGGTIYEICVYPESLRELQEPLSAFISKISEGSPEISQEEVLAVEKIIFSSGMLDFTGSAYSSILIQEGNSREDDIYRSKFYLAYDENSEAWGHKLIFSQNSDYTPFFRDLPADTIAAFFCSSNIKDIKPLIENLELEGLPEDLFNDWPDFNGIVGVTVWGNDGVLCVTLALPPACLEQCADGFGEMVSIERNGCVLLFDSQEQVEAWDNSGKLTTELPVELDGTAGFFYLGRECIVKCIEALESEDFLQEYLDAAVEFDDERIISVVRDKDGISFREYAHTDFIGSLVLAFGRFLMPVGKAASDTNWQEDYNSLGSNINGDLMLFLMDNGGFPGNDEVYLLADIFPGEAGVDFIYRCPEELEEVVPVCVLAPEDGYCLVVYSDCDQKYIPYDEMSGSVGVIGVLQSGYPMPEEAFREWVELSSGCEF